MRGTKNLEFKDNVTATFLKTVSVFANYGTGQVLFGVRDDGQRLGLDHAIEKCSKIEQLINDTISPPTSI